MCACCCGAALRRRRALAALCSAAHDDAKPSCSHRTHCPPIHNKALLAALAALYVAAFTSLLLNGPGLLGAGGAAPAEGYLALSAEQLAGSGGRLRLFLAAPSLLRLHSAVGLSVDAALQLLCAAGLALALGVLWAVSGSGGGDGDGGRIMRPGGGALTAALAALWLMLLSVRNVGQGFLAGPWEALLLEAGWAAIWLAAAAAPAEGAPAAAAASAAAPPPALLLLRWQLFKALLLGAMSRLRAACSGAGGARDATLAACFARVAATVPTPSRVAWVWADAAPPALQAAALAVVAAAELPGALLALAPFRGARLAGAALQLAALAVGALTGAAGAAPALPLAALCLALADDDALAALCTRGLFCPAAGAAAAAPSAPAGGRRAAPKLTPIKTGGRARRDSLDELLASPRYHGAPPRAQGQLLSIYALAAGMHPSPCFLRTSMSCAQYSTPSFPSSAPSTTQTRPARSCAPARWRRRPRPTAGRTAARRCRRGPTASRRSRRRAPRCGRTSGPTPTPLLLRALRLHLWPPWLPSCWAPAARAASRVAPRRWPP